MKEFSPSTKPARVEGEFGTCSQSHSVIIEDILSRTRNWTQQFCGTIPTQSVVWILWIHDQGKKCFDHFFFSETHLNFSTRAYFHVNCCVINVVWLHKNIWRCTCQKYPPIIRGKFGLGIWYIFWLTEILSFECIISRVLVSAGVEITFFTGM